MIKAVALTALFTNNVNHNYKAHNSGCRTKACDNRVYIWWGKHHHPPKAYIANLIETTFDKCVVFKESSNNRYASNGTDVSYYQWLPSTYITAARMAGEEEKYPTEATLEEQTRAFNIYYRYDPDAWPVTAPECGGV